MHAAPQVAFCAGQARTRYAPRMTRLDARICDNCGHDRSGSESPVCNECGVPQGGLRFAQLPAARFDELCAALRLLGQTNLSLAAAAAGFLSLLLGTLLRGMSGGFESGALVHAMELLGSALIWLGIALLTAGPCAAIVLAWIGLSRLQRTVDPARGAQGSAHHDASHRDTVHHDAEVGDAARDALRFSVVATAFVVPLLVWNPPWAAGTIAIGASVVAALLVAMQLLMLARLRALCGQRSHGRKEAAWPVPLSCLLVSALSLALPSAGGILIDPVIPLVFMVGNALELGRFPRVERPLRALSPCGRGDPS